VLYIVCYMLICYGELSKEYHEPCGLSAWGYLNVQQTHVLVVKCVIWEIVMNTGASKNS